MNQRDFDNKLIELMKEIRDLYHQYNPEGKYLTLCYIEREDEKFGHVDHLSAYNCDHEHPVDLVFYGEDNEIKYSDGEFVKL